MFTQRYIEKSNDLPDFINYEVLKKISHQNLLQGLLKKNFSTDFTIIDGVKHPRQGVETKIPGRQICRCRKMKQE